MKNTKKKNTDIKIKQILSDTRIGKHILIGLKTSSTEDLTFHFLFLRSLLPRGTQYIGFLRLYIIYIYTLNTYNTYIIYLQLKFARLAN